MPQERKKVTPGRLARYRRLKAAERSVVRSASILLPLTRMGIRIVGYRRWRSLLEKLSTSGERAETRAEADTLSASRIAHLIHAAACEGILTGACLERSMVLWFLLRRRNLSPELRIGARKEGEKFQAHAWVELGGAALDEFELSLEYVPFDELPMASEAKVR